MSYKIPSTFGLFILIVVISSGVAFNCSNVLKIEKGGVLNYLANVTFQVPVKVDGDWDMEIQTDGPFTFLGGWGFWVRNDEDEGKAFFRSKAENLTMEVGEKLSIRFRISWHSSEPMPNVVSIKFEGTQICIDDGISIEKLKALRKKRTSNSRPPYNRRRVNFGSRF